MRKILYPVCLTLANTNLDLTGERFLAEPSELEAQHEPESLLSQSGIILNQKSLKISYVSTICNYFADYEFAFQYQSHFFLNTYVY